MRISYCRDARDNYPMAVDATWDEFVDDLRKMSYEEIVGADKEACKAQAMGIVACAYGADGRRVKENALPSWFVWLDAEEGQPNELNKALAAIRELRLEAVVYTSAGHKPPRDRFRIIIPVASPIPDRDSYERIWTKFKDLIGVRLDLGKRAAYNILYQPARYSSCPANEFYHLTGAVLTAEDWLSVCPELPKPEPVETVPLAASRVNDAYVRRAIEGEVQRVRDAVPGADRLGRHDSLLVAGLNLAELHLAGVLDWSNATDALRAVALEKMGHGRRAEIDKVLTYALKNASPREIKKDAFAPHPLDGLIKQEWLNDYAMSGDENRIVAHIKSRLKRMKRVVEEETIKEYVRKYHVKG